MSLPPHHSQYSPARVTVHRTRGYNVDRLQLGPKPMRCDAPMNHLEQEGGKLSWRGGKARRRGIKKEVQDKFLSHAVLDAQIVCATTYTASCQLLAFEQAFDRYLCMLIVSLNGHRNAFGKLAIKKHSTFMSSDMIICFHPGAHWLTHGHTFIFMSWCWRVGLLNN